MSKDRVYKDVRVARGSQLYEALEVQDQKLAEKIYQECEKEFRRYFPSGKILILDEESQDEQDDRCLRGVPE